MLRFSLPDSDARSNGKTTTDAGFTITFGTLTFFINYNKEGTPSPQLNSPVLQRNVLQTQPQTNQNNTKIDPHHAKAQHSNQQMQNRNPSRGRLVTTNRQSTTAQRFFKVPPVTAQWQRVGTKRKQQNAQNKKCFFCKKTGHIQRFCWKKIKCHKCGRLGHKWANCLFIAPHNTTASFLKQSNPNQNKQKEPNLHCSQSEMEFIHGRPP